MSSIRSRHYRQTVTSSARSKMAISFLKQGISRIRRRTSAVVKQRLLHASCVNRNMLKDEEKQFKEFEGEYLSAHIETNPLQKALLAVGSAAISLYDPTRADMICVLGETAGTSAIRYMLEKMEASPEGQQILRKRPRINSQTVDLDRLRALPEGTLGRAYTKFLDVNKVTPDSRMMVQFVDDIELAYVIQRYREVHDIFHTVLGMPTNMLGEVTVKWVEAIQTRLPMCIGGALFGAVRLAPKQRKRYVNYNLPWAIKTGKTSEFLMNVYYEQRWEQPLCDLHEELNIKTLVIPKL